MWVSGRDASSMCRFSSDCLCFLNEVGIKVSRGEWGIGGGVGHSRREKSNCCSGELKSERTRVTWKHICLKNFLYIELLYVAKCTILILLNIVKLPSEVILVHIPTCSKSASPSFCQHSMLSNIFTLPNLIVENDISAILICILLI